MTVNSVTPSAVPQGLRHVEVDYSGGGGHPGT